ncbi:MULTISPECIES: response regulator [Pseudomonas aeruginosa group]|nr:MULTISPECIES: response regulator transcription factor [Pseudomonas aeruginosa group]VTS50150.1 response regulator protein [Streptococcus dysgalactiae subsp. equisimilis]AVR70708.1 DNA-binding response regulator [Pseudomonas paraeruginosa]KAB0752122.1 response regulator transcription factor [Pseudomonas aeruginosa]KRU94501.1 LuxR family transcriptional regulator [Pseudomonas aeruginosa]KSD73885.1 DNA-binding response regulator [Pseudomonas aeruginosa]
MPIRTIIADKHQMFRQGLAALLNTDKEIMTLAQADDGEQALFLIETLKPDIAILEVALPRLSGIEIAQRISRMEIETCIVILTSCEDPLVAVSTVEAGASAYVLKKAPFDALVAALHTVVTGGTFISPELRGQFRELGRKGVRNITLSSREREVIRLIACGKSAKEVAKALDISPRTVDTYKERMMKKIQAHGVADIVRYAIRIGVIDR